jgi:hypothetical protein
MFYRNRRLLLDALAGGVSRREIPPTARPAPGDARHVETFLSEYPRRARRGIVVCRVERVERLTQRVVAVPWDRL